MRQLSCSLVPLKRRSKLGNVLAIGSWRRRRKPAGGGGGNLVWRWCGRCQDDTEEPIRKVNRRAAQRILRSLSADLVDRRLGETLPEETGLGVEKSSLFQRVVGVAENRLPVLLL